MKVSRWLVCLLLLLGAGAAVAQEKARAAEEPKPGTPLNVQVVFTDYEGEKKVSSIPYTLSVIANDPTRRPSRIRMGVRVPIQTVGKEGQWQIQYMDVGVNIDCSAKVLEDGRYQVELGVERSSIYSTASSSPGAVEGGGSAGQASGQPTVRQFRAEFTTFLRNGQTIQNTLATDPVSGRVLKVDVTLNEVK